MSENALDDKNSICLALEALIGDMRKEYKKEVLELWRKTYSVGGYMREFGTIQIATGRRLGCSTGIMQYIYNTVYSEKILIVVPYQVQMDRYKEAFKKQLNHSDVPRIITMKQLMDYEQGQSVSDLRGAYFDVMIVDNYSTIKTIEGFDKALDFLYALNMADCMDRHPILVKAG